MSDGTCLSCFPGYKLNNGACLPAIPDPNCQRYDEVKKICLQCAIKYFVDTTGKCKQVSPLCKTFNPTNGACLSCFSGYIVLGVTCVVGNSSNSDSNCESLVNSVCQKCYSGYFLSSSNICTQSNALCKTFDRSNGACLSCYPGYSLSAGNCVLGVSPTASKDPNCKTSDASGVCTACYTGFYLTLQNNCLKLDPLCKTYTAAFNACDSCYDGYVLFNGACVIPAQLPVTNSDPYCIKIQGANCLACANGYYLPVNGSCTALNPLCKSSDMATGFCTLCYPGYTISGSTCIVASAPTIAYCSKMDGNVCIECINGYIVRSGGCTAVDPLCGKYNQTTGGCVQCFSGYVLQDELCFQPSLGIDQNCLRYSNSYCTQCSPKYSLVNYWCTLVDPYCLQFDATNNICALCVQGKSPQGPGCL